MSPTTTSSQTYVEYTQESSGEQRYPDDFDYDDIAIGKTFLDACRRRADHFEEESLSSSLSVIIERRDPLFAPLSSAQKKLRETPLRMNRLGFFWNDKESKSSLTVKQRYENTNSKRITTEEVYKN